jgi:hypothetical protein
MCCRCATTKGQTTVVTVMRGEGEDIESSPTVGRRRAFNRNCSKIFSQEAEQEMTATLEFAAEEEA